MTRSGGFRGVPWRGLVAAGAAVLALTVGLARPAQAATRFVATTGNDAANTCLASGSPCKTITHALSQAVASDTISVAAGTYNLALGETFPLVINQNLTLSGAGAGSTIIDATGANTRVITVNSGVTATISGVTITGGNVSCSGACQARGGGLFNEDTLTLTNSTLSGNTASCTNSGSGECNAHAGLSGSSTGTLTLTNITLSGNTASCTNSGSGSCSANGGLRAHGTVTLTNSTLSGNTASCTNSGSGSCAAAGGGIANTGLGGTLTVTNSTLSGNTASCTNSGSGSCVTGGAGILNQTTLAVLNATVTANSVTCSGVGCDTLGGGLLNFAGTTTLQNTIVAKQLAGADCGILGGTITSLGHNLDSDNTCPLTQPSDKPNVTNPLLGPLQNNGGPTQTHALMPGSPAIDAVTSGCPPPATDQRGIARPQGAACDIGAVEVSAAPPVPQLLNVMTLSGPGGAEQQTFLPTDPITAEVTYFDPNAACAGVAPVLLQLLAFNQEGQLILTREDVTSAPIAPGSKYRLLSVNLAPGALSPGAYTLIFLIRDCTSVNIFVSSAYAIRVVTP